MRMKRNLISFTILLRKGRTGMDWIDLAQDRDMRAPVNALTNLQVPQNWANFFTS
jgi:hypothetical protein